MSRKITELGIYPAVDPLESTSRILDPLIVGQEQYDVAQRVKQILQRNKQMCIRDRRFNSSLTLPPPAASQISFNFVSAGNTGSVSYTHLDVYKRQIFSR